MKPTEKKERFVILRAEGKSYTAIAEELNISKSTCTAWERELKEAIAEKKAESLNALYTAYSMGHEARVKKLGERLATVEAAAEEADLTAIAPEKLIRLEMDLRKALKEEYIAPSTKGEPIPENAQPADVLRAFVDLLNRVRAGEVTDEQATKESNILTALLKAYEQTELQQRIEALESILRERE